MCRHWDRRSGSLRSLGMFALGVVELVCERIAGTVVKERERV